MRKLKITSLILVVVMLLGMIPMGIFSASAAVTAPTTVPSGKDGVNWNYTTYDLSKGSVAIASAGAANGISNNIGYSWRGATGFLLQIDTTAASNLFLQAAMSFGSFGYSSYMRITTAQNVQGCDPTIVGALVSDGYVYDGTSWTKQTTTNVNANGDDYFKLPANFSGYVYVPFDQWYWQGNGGNQNVKNFLTPFAGCTAEYFLSHFETPTLNNINLWTNTANTMTVNSVKVVYADKGLAPTDDVVAEDFAWDSESGKTNWQTGWNDKNEDGKNDKGEEVYSPDYQVCIGKENGNYVNLKDVYVGGKPNVGYFLSNTKDNYNDLSDAAGVSVTVDTTKLGDAQLRVRPYLQYLGGASDTAYREYMIVNATGDTMTKAPVNFYNSLKGYESFSQFVTRTRGSVAYLKAEGSDTWTALFATVAGNNAADDGYFQLPAGFKGEVYIPMDSYWFCMQNNSDTVIIPWDLSLVTDFRSFGMFSSLSKAVGEGAANEVTYSDFKIYRPVQDKVEIDTAEDLIYFFDHLNEYAGKKVVLTNDIILNAGWDADSLTAPEVQLGARSAANNTFAGTFDGQGHVISGLYLKSDSRSFGLFGYVNRNTQATVKNVSIVNSYLQNTTGGTAPGNEWAADPVSGGSIFGAVLTDMVKDSIAKADAITDPRHVSNTRATIENVYSDVNITTTASRGNGMSGYGGLVGIVQSDLHIIGSTYAGTLKSTVRGAAGLVGSIYPPENGTTMQKVNLTIDDSMVTGKLVADLSGKTGAYDSMVGGAVGYANPACADITIRNSIFAAEMHNACGKNKNGTSRTAQTGYIYGGAWSDPLTTRTGGTEYQRWRLANVYAYDVSADDSVTKAFGGSNKSLKVWWNDGGLNDLNKDGTVALAEAAAKNSNADACKCVQIASAAQLPTILNYSTVSMEKYGGIATSMVLGDALTYEIKLPVGWATLSPNATITDAFEAQIGGKKDASVEAKLSDDKAYIVATFEGILPQDVSGIGRRLVIKHTAYNEQVAAGNVPALSDHDIADTGSNFATANNTIENYLTALYNDEATSSEAKDLVVDLLKYASETREFFGLSKINTSKLTGGAEFTEMDIVANANGSGVHVEGDLYNFEALYFRCDTKLAVQISVSVGGEYTATLNGVAIEVDNSKAADEGYILIYLNPAAWDRELQVVDPQTGATLHYYLSDYFAWVVEDDTIEQRQKDLVFALYGYMVSAQAYAASLAE